MTTAFWAVTVAAIPVGIVVGLLWLAHRCEQQRDALHARQIELTDAIHREMGAAAAPTVERLRGGGWLVRVMVPVDRPAVAAAILRVTHRVFASPRTGDPLQIVLTSRPASPATMAGRLRSARRRPVRSAASIVAAVR